MKGLGAIAEARFWIFGMLTAMAITAAGAVEQADGVASPMSWNPPLPASQLNVGIHFGDQQVETFGDVLVPVFQHSRDLIFVNPRGSWNDDDSQEFNFGLGGRHIFPDKSIIIGANLFYDRRSTALGNTFNQAGMGAEFLSQWLDARLNGYLPEDGEKTADNYIVSTATSQEHNEYWYAPAAQGHVISQYGYEVNNSYQLKNLQHYRTSERAMKGFDGEIGSLLPVPVLSDYADIKLFVGYYDYHAHYGPDVAGMKGRVEVRPVPAVYLDAGWVEDKELTGSRYSAGIRASLPFDLARLSRGQNPFSGALSGFKMGPTRPPFARRLTEMVVRDLHVRTDVSKPAEVVEDRRVLEKVLIAHSRKDVTEILATDVTFVDGDNRSGMENGSWENPYRQINTGMQNAIGPMVYVNDAAQPYRENVVMRAGGTLWGSGAPIYGRHGVFQGAAYPVVNGGGAAPTITLANNVMVTGFELVQPAGLPSSRSVVYGENVSGVTIISNTIHGNGSAPAGIELNASSLPFFNATIADNRISGALGNGIDISVASIPQVAIGLSQNSVTSNNGDGLRVFAVDCDDFRISVSGNYNGNGVNGIAATVQSFTGDVEVKLSDVTAEANAGNGTYLDVYGYNSVKVDFSNVIAGNNGSDGIHAIMVSGRTVSASFSNNRLAANGADGLFIDLNSGLDSRIVARDNMIAHNLANGVNLQTLAPSDSIYDFGQATDFGLNALYANDGFQMVFNGPGIFSAAGNWWGTPTPLDNVDYQAVGGGLISVAPALPAPPIP